MAPRTRSTTASAVTAAMHMTLSPPPILGKLVSSSPHNTPYSAHHAAHITTSVSVGASGTGGVETMQQPASEQLVAFAGAQMEAMAAELGELRHRCTRLEAELADRDAEVLGKALESAKRSEEERDSWFAKKTDAGRSPGQAPHNPEASPTTATQTPATKTSPAFTFFHTGGALSTGGSDGIAARGDTTIQKTGAREEELEAMEKRARVAENRAVELEAALEALGEYLLTVDSDGARRLADIARESKSKNLTASLVSASHSEHDKAAAALQTSQEAGRLGSVSDGQPDEHGGTLARWGLGPIRPPSSLDSAQVSTIKTHDAHDESDMLAKSSIQAAYDVVARLEKAVQRNGDMLAKFAEVEKEIEQVRSHAKLQRESAGRMRTVSVASGFSSDSSASDSDDFGSDAVELRSSSRLRGRAEGVPNTVDVREDGSQMRITPAPRSLRDIPGPRRSTIHATRTPVSVTRLTRRTPSITSRTREERTPPPPPPSALFENGSVTGDVVNSIGGSGSAGGASATRQRKHSFTDVVSGGTTKKALLRELAKGLTKSSSLASARRRSML